MVELLLSGEVIENFAFQGAWLSESARLWRCDLALAVLVVVHCGKGRLGAREVPHRFRTGDPVGFSPGKDGNECREKRKDTLLSSRSRLPGR